MRGGWIVALAALLLAGSVASAHPSSYEVARADVRAELRAARGATGSDPVTIAVNDSVDATGWLAVRITRNANVSVADDAAVWLAAGEAEGFATAKRIDDVWRSAMAPQLPLHPKVLGFVQEHVAYMQVTAAAQRNVSRYWRTVFQLLLQVEGIATGYQRAAAATAGLSNLTAWDVFLLNFNYELMDIQDKFGVTGGIAVASAPRRRIQGGGCSAFVKSTGEDVLMGHATWTGYNMMLKAWKDYDFAGVRVQMSSVPGTIASGDDWYQLSPTKLLVTETTHYNYNMALYRDFTIPQTVSEFLRVMVANHLATDGRSWTATFATLNSGTYNNAYTVVDLKKFVPGTATADLPDGLVWLTEQLPGLCPSEDVTPIMRRQGYWASYNRPAIPLVYNVSGTRAMFDKFGDLFSYEMYPRARIFRRNATDVVDQRTFQLLMRYDNFLHDPLSVCATCSDPPGNPWLAIAARGDLTPATQKQGDWASFLGGASADGAIDAKVGSYRMYHDGLRASIVAGPTHVQQPVFRWSTSVVNGQVPRFGQPDAFDFDWVNPQEYFGSA